MRSVITGSIILALSTVIFFAAYTSRVFPQNREYGHFETRNAILARLSEYRKCRAANETGVCDSLAGELNWRTGLYNQIYGVRDLSLRFSIYDNWDREQARKRLSIDSLYIKWLNDCRSKPDSSLPARLDDLMKEYASINDSFQLAALIKCRAQLCEAHDKIDSAIYYYGECIDRCRRLDYFSLMGDCEMLLGLIYNYRLGNYLQSELAYRDAIEHFRRVDERGDIALVQLGRVYDFLQLYKTEAAIRLANSLLPDLEKTGDLQNQARCHYFLSVAYNNLGMLDSALFYGNQALDLRENIASQGRRLEDLGYSMTYLGQIYQALGNRDQALSMYRSADSIFQMVEAPEGISNNLIAWGNYLVEIEAYGLATSKFDDISRLSISYEIMLAAAYGLAVCDYHLGNTRQAIERLKHCVWLVENTNRKLPVPEMKTGILSDKVGYFNLLACIYIEQFLESGQNIYVDSALQYLEQSKSRALIDDLMISNGHEIDSVENRILRQISDIHKSDRLSRNPEAALREIHNLEDSLLMRYVEISKNHEEAIDDSTLGDLSIKKIQSRAIDEKTVLVQYLLSHFGNYIFVISKDRCSVVPIATDYQTLQSMVRQYLESINTSPENDDDLDGYRRLGGELYSILIPEKELSAASKNHIMMVTSGPLHYLPLGSLTDHDGKFLIENYSLSYAPSVSALALISRRDYTVDDKPGVVVFAYSPPSGMDNPAASNDWDVAANAAASYWDLNNLPPLISCSLEVRAIERCFGADNTKIYAKGDGTEDNFGQVIFHRGDYLHISAHGLTDERNPDRSAILLGGGDGSVNDGFLRPREIRQRNIPARLVFLSSCRSGTGKSFPGEGVMSLARPFLSAGCQSAIVTYWNISDLTSAEFVGHFYRGVKDGLGPSEALALAKRDFINSKRQRLRHPYFWAPFVLIGQ